MRKLERVKNPRYYYHVTSRNLGKSVKLQPRHGSNMSKSEPDLKRICVSCSVPGCLSAIYVSGDRLYVYKTTRKVIAHEPYDVEDITITKEKWLLKKTLFRKVAFYPSWFTFIFHDTARGDPLELSMQRKDLKQIKQYIEKNGKLTKKGVRTVKQELLYNGENSKPLFYK